MLVHLENLKSHFDGDEELIIELLEVFAESYVTVLDSLNKAVEEKNYKEVELHAHTLKGMIANFFAEDLKVSAFFLEKGGRDENVLDFAPHLKKLEDDIPVMINEVKAIGA